MFLYQLSQYYNTNYHNITIPIITILFPCIYICLYFFIKFSATVTTRGFAEKLKNAVIAFLKSIHEAAVAVLNVARDALAEARKKLQEAEATVEGWKTGIDEWKNRLKAQKRRLQEKAQHTPPCNPVCQLGFTILLFLFCM